MVSVPPPADIRSALGRDDLDGVGKALVARCRRGAEVLEGAQDVVAVLSSTRGNARHTVI